MKLPPNFPRRVEAVVCDLDRTLLPADLVLRPRTIAALGRAREAGLRVTIATGRMFHSVRPFALAAGIVDPVVCYQGGLIGDPVSGRVLHHEPIPLELALEAVTAIEEEGFPVNAYVDDALYVERRVPETDLYVGIQGTEIEVHEVGPLRAWLRQPPTKLVAVGDPEALVAAEARLRDRFGARLYIARSLRQFLEFTAPGVTKSAALAWLAQRLGFSAERTLAFGDGENDLELIEAAGYGVAVANAHASVRAAADLVCPSVDEEGVAQVLEAYLDSRT